MRQLRSLDAAYAWCACGHTLRRHEMDDNSGPCKAAGCGCAEARPAADPSTVPARGAVEPPAAPPPIAVVPDPEPAQDQAPVAEPEAPTAPPARHRRDEPEVVVPLASGGILTLPPTLTNAEADRVAAHVAAADRLDLIRRGKANPNPHLQELAAIAEDALARLAQGLRAWDEAAPRLAELERRKAEIDAERERLIAELGFDGDVPCPKACGRYFPSKQSAANHASQTHKEG